MLKSLFCDLGNVLLFFDPEKMLNQVARCAGIAVSSLQKMLHQSDLQFQYERGEIDSSNLYQLLKQKATKPFSLHEMLDAFSNIFTPNEEIFPIIEELQRRNVRLILLSNTCDSHYNRAYSDYPIVRAFDHTILSFEVKKMKPNPLIFHRALSVAQCLPHECLYIDDTRQHVESANKVGLPAIHFTSVGKLKKDLVNKGIVL